MNCLDELTNVTGTTGQPSGKNKVGSIPLSLYIYPKWIKDLSMEKKKTIQFLEETTGEIFFNFGMENVFLVMTHNTDPIKSKLINKTF